MSAAVYSSVVPGPDTRGITTMTTPTRTRMPTRPATTSGNERSAEGIGLRMPVEENVSSASSARLRLRCRKSKPARIATRFTTSPIELP